MRPIGFRIRIVAALLLLGGTALHAGRPDGLPAPPPGVQDEVDLEQAAAEEVLARADAALWLPKQRLVRFTPVGARGEADRFLAQVEALLPALESGELGPWLLKRPARGEVLPTLLAASRTGPAPQAQVFVEGFESLASWDLADNRNGVYTFAATTCQARSGSRSADAIRGGSTGQTLGCSTGYPAQTITQIMHKSCEALSGASQAWLDFWMSASMTSTSDSIGIGYIPQGSTGWVGYTFTGKWPDPGPGWYHVVQSLKQWYSIGDIGSLSCPKLLIQFASGNSGGGGFGARVDDLTIGTDTPSFLRATINASPASGPAPLSVTFTPTLGGATGTETFQWRFGDAAGSSATTQNATFTYTAPGDYNPRLIVFGNNVLASAQTKVHVDAPCTLSCTASAPGSAAAGAAVSFTATASGCTGTPTWAWVFGDGQTSTSQNPSHAYAAAGTYSWSLTTTVGSNTCSKSGSITVTGGTSAVPGDCNSDGRVDIGEVQKAINMLLGTQAVGCGVDANGNGSVDISEVQRVINAYLGGTSGSVAVTVNPPAATIVAGGTQQFTATVTGTSNTAVTWSVQEGSAGGTVTSQGLYTAPATSGLYHVIATSQADTTKSGSATVSVGAATSQKGIVYGTVTDVAGTAVGDATVTIGSLSAATNGQGYFTVNDVPVGANTLVNVAKTGYVPTAKIIRVSAGQGSFLEVTLPTAKPSQTINVGSGGTVTTPEGGSVTIPPGGMVTMAGSPHTGPANVSATVFDPTNPAHLNAFPGNFEGVTKSGQTIFFVTFGWMDVTVTTPEGAPLQVAPGKTATLKIPVPAAIQSAAPSSLPQWWFDPASGVWREEGTFTYANGAYTGNVTHLSIWNCDVGAARCTISGRIVDPAGNPVECARVSLMNLGPRGRFTSGESCTGADGRFAVPVDANSTVEITASKGGTKSAPLTTETCPDGGSRDVGDIVLGVVPVKITLTWGQNPPDIDAHLAIPKAAGGGYGHLYYSAKNVEDSRLDTDDQNGWGPEIVTIASLHPGTYRYSVHHYSSSSTTTIATSPAVVNLVIEGQGIFTFTPPAGARGTKDLWRVFDLVVDSNKRVTLRPINNYAYNVTSNTDPAFFPQ